MPEREDVQRRVMTLYHEYHAMDELVNQYHYLEDALKRRYNLGPSRETRELYQRFVAG